MNPALVADLLTKKSFKLLPLIRSPELFYCSVFVTCLHLVKFSVVRLIERLGDVGRLGDWSELTRLSGVRLGSRPSMWPSMVDSWLWGIYLHPLGTPSHSVSATSYGDPAHIKEHRDYRLVLAASMAGARPYPIPIACTSPWARHFHWQ